MNKKRLGHNFSLIQLFDSLSPLQIVDIGANPIDGTPPYKRLLDQGLVVLTGFEPQLEALQKLNQTKGPKEQYFPYVVGDGNCQTLHITHAPGMTSLLEPNPETLDLFHGFPQWGAVKNKVKVDTVRLDDISEIDTIDYLKIDIQGAELMVFQNGVEQLKNCLAIHTEVEFLSMYKKQPLFSEVEMFLRSQGFLFHRFAPLVSRALRPMLVNDDIYKGMSQMFWGDAVFLRDFTKLDTLTEGQLLKFALICHDIYKSFDVALKILLEYDARTNSNISKRYLQKLSPS